MRCSKEVPSPRSRLRHFFAATLVGLCAIGGTAVSSAKETPLRALLVVGGCCHDYAGQSIILRDGIQARANVQVDVIRSEDEGTGPYFPMYEKKDWAKGYDVIIHDECAADRKEMPYVQNIVDAHKNGLPGVNLHCAMHSYRTGSPIWFEYLGLQSSGHGWQKPIKVDYVVTDHPITQGLKDWKTTDEELYNNAKVFDTAKPLAMGTQETANGGEDSSVVAWTNDYHGTRVFSTTLGHNNTTVGDKRYLDLVVRGLLWSCDKLNPAYLTAYKGPKGSVLVVPAKPDGPDLTEAPANAVMTVVTASSAENGNGSFKALDGKEDTRWCASSGDFPQWLQLEFEKPQTLTGLAIVWESADQSYRHTVESSADGKSWKTLIDATANATKTDFAKQQMKFVRITCSGASGGWASIREVKVMGDGGSIPLFPKQGENPTKPDGPPKKPAETPEPPPTSKNTKDLEKSGNSAPFISKLTAEQEAAILSDVKVADGLEVTLFSNSTAANYPVYVAAAPNGDLYVSSDGAGSVGRESGRGRVLRLRDTDQDGKADEVTEFVKDVDSPRGLVWDNDRLYLLHPPDISVFIDRDGDGKAEKKETLIKGIAFGFEDRPADHTTNGLSLGIDGWLYIAGGDFGFMNAVGTDGRKLQNRGGGVIRFRPDGSGLEMFSSGTRNILGTPISPLLDLFARDNTNDGGGWDVRFHHFTGLEDHGYPRMYINFADEIIKPLADYGGGSGCGSVYLSEPGFPEKWNDAPLTCDWGTGALWRHTVSPKGATFTETKAPEKLIEMTRPTDTDVDGLSNIYQASWKGATFEWAGPDVGYIVKVSPKGYQPEPLPDFNKASDQELIRLLESKSQVRTMEAQRALLRRPGTAAMRDGLLALAGDAAKPLPARVAALYALTQRATKTGSADSIMKVVRPLAADETLQRFVLRALSDAGLDGFAAGRTTAPEDLYIAGLKSSNPRTRLEAIVGAARQNMKGVGPAIATALGDADPVVAHTAFQGLAKLATPAPCFAIIDNANAPKEQRLGALRALMRMHQPEVVAGLISRLDRTTDPSQRQGLLAALCRLHFTEGKWKGDSWGTRPDTRGPYYQPETWAESGKISKFLKEALAKATPLEASFLLPELQRNRIEFSEARDRMLALAKDNAEFLPEVVTQLAAAQTIPESGMPYLIDAAKSNGPPEMIAKAIATLAKTDSEEGFIAALAGLEKLSQTQGAGKLLDVSRKAFLESPKLENHHQLFESLAAKMEGASSRWADAALLALSARQTGSPESKQLSQSDIDQGWQDSKRRVQILQAIQMTGFQGLNDRVLLAVSDTNPDVAKAAGATAKALRIDEKSADKTPLVSSLKPDEVIAAISGMKADVELGKQLFTRQSCVNCHAVTLDEPQKGPYLGTIAQTYTRPVLAEAIINPAKTIAQGFATEVFTLKDGSSQMGFVTLETPDEVKVRNIASQEFTFKTADIASREKMPTSMMPPGLVDGLTTHQLASLLDYLESLSK